MTEARYAYEPDFVSPPGDTLEEMLSDRSMTQKELANRIGRPLKTINEIIKGKTAITSETALQFEKVFGASAGYWMQREAHYREHLSRIEEYNRFSSYLPWLADLPLPDLRKNGILSATRDKVAQVSELLNFFGVASPEEWRQVYTEPQVAYRISTPDKTDPGAIASWLRMGELEAHSMRCEPFNRAKFSEALKKIRLLTIHDPQDFVPQMVELCSKSGVALVFIPALPRCRISGVTRWLAPDKALIQLSLYGKYNDRFWFTFFHEAGHILMHGKKLVFLDGDKTVDGAEEDAANRFAANILIPRDQSRLFHTIRPQTKWINTFAAEVGIHPGIVVGRMQHEGLLPMNYLNGLKDKFEFVSEKGMV